MPKKIDPGLKERALRMVADHRQDYPSDTALAAAVANQLGVGRGDARRWVVQAEIDAGGRPGMTTDEHAEIKRLKAEEPAAAGGQRDPEGGHGFLRRGARPPQPLIMAFIDDMRAEGHAVESTCGCCTEQGCPVAARTYRSWAGQPRGSRPDPVIDAALTWTRCWQGGGTPGRALRAPQDDPLAAPARATRWRSAR